MVARADGKKKKMTRCSGVLDPERLYTREGILKAAGLGHVLLTEARKSGIVKPVYLGRRVYYRGSQIIEWILHVGQPTPTNDR